MVIILNDLVFVMPQISVFQGGKFCRFSFGRALPGNVQSALAIFENLDTVEVERCGGEKENSTYVDSYCLYNEWLELGGRGGIFCWIM